MKPSASSGRLARYIASAAVLSAAVVLSGCTGSTYGTGTPAGLQTVQDIAGIAGARGENDPIDYEARPPVVLPPEEGVLPPPGSGTTDAQQVASLDWPVDPDEKAAALQNARDASNAQRRSEDAKPLNAFDPRFSLPEGSRRPTARDTSDMSSAQRALMTPEQERRAREAFAKAQGNNSVDENGNPIRQHLSDPPVTYRARDDDVPEGVAQFYDCKEPPAIRLPWRERKPDECPPGVKPGDPIPGTGPAEPAGQG